MTLYIELDSRLRGNDARYQARSIEGAGRSHYAVALDECLAQPSPFCVSTLSPPPFKGEIKRGSSEARRRGFIHPNAHLQPKPWWS